VTDAPPIKPEWEALWKQAAALGKADAAGDRGPVVLTGELANHQDAYDDAWMGETLRRLEAKDSN
jgi:hypothetical protein